jgi:hypothetical protein
MGRRNVSGWERKFRNVVAHLTSSAQDLFGNEAAVAYRPPEPAPGRESGSPAEHAHGVARAAGKGDRLPPRERRGRD